jgi:hypothetical protein
VDALGVAGGLVAVAWLALADAFGHGERELASTVW